MVLSVIWATPFMSPKPILFSPAWLTFIDLELHHFYFGFQQQPPNCFFHCSHGLASLATPLMANMWHAIYISPLLNPWQPQLFLTMEKIFYFSQKLKLSLTYTFLLNLQYAPHFLNIEWWSQMCFFGSEVVFWMLSLDNGYTWICNDGLYLSFF